MDFALSSLMGFAQFYACGVSAFRCFRVSMPSAFLWLTPFGASLFLWAGARS